MTEVEESGGRRSPADHEGREAEGSVAPRLEILGRGKSLIGVKRYANLGVEQSRRSNCVSPDAFAIKT